MMVQLIILIINSLTHPHSCIKPGPIINQIKWQIHFQDKNARQRKLNTRHPKFTTTEVIILEQEWRIAEEFVLITKKIESSNQTEHFPLPFSDQMLERLTWKYHYYFLDGLSNDLYNHVTLEKKREDHIHMFIWNFWV